MTVETLKIQPGCRFSKCLELETANVQSAPKRGWLWTLKRWIGLRRQRRIDRDAFMHMTALDDAMLSDIGVTRADVIWASKLPLSENASVALHNLAHERRSRCEWGIDT